MDPNSIKTMAAAAGAGSKEGEYVEDIFSTDLWTGTGSSRTVTTGIDLDENDGMIWIKARTASYDHNMYDTERGATYRLVPNNDSAHTAEATGLTAFNSNGWSTGSSAYTNESGKDYVGWTFREAPGFFDVVQFTKSSDAAASFTHNLGCVPGMMIITAVSKANHWSVWHKSLPESDEDFLHLNESGGYETSSTRFGADPTATHFTVGSHNEFSGSNTYVAYLFADGDDSDAQIFGEKGDESIIKMGTYTGNGSTTGPEINLGWEPQFLIIKKSSAGDSWQLKDVMRRFSLKQLLINSNGGEAPADEASRVDPTPTGFAVKTSDGAFNSNSGTYVYMAIRRGPMKTPEDATKVFAIDYGANADPAFDSGFTVDAAIRHPTYASAGNNPRIYSRLQDTKHLYTSYTGGEGTEANSVWNSHAGFYKDDSTNAIAWMFQRAPGFMDVVCYEGTGSARWQTHNLGVTPELILIKRRDSTSNWVVGHKDMNGGTDPWSYYLYLQANDSQGSSGNQFDDTAGSATQFRLGGSNDVNGNTYTYVAFLFASLDGISKVGSYTGPSIGNNVEVDCGFSAGARFVLIKRTDSANDWFVFDSTRGISTGSDDPYFFLNTTAAQVTDQDKLDVNSSGFTVRPNADAESGLNTNGGTYIYLAIA